MANGKLNVFMVGTFAAVWRYENRADQPSGVRFLLPFAEQDLSKFDSHVTIFKSEPFIGVPIAAIRNDVKPLFVRRYEFPVMEDAGETAGDVVEVGFFALNQARVLKIDFKSSTRFVPIDGPIGEKPTKDTAPYLSWAADMSVYSNENAQVAEPYLDDEHLPQNVAVVQFDRGRFSVARVGFGHQFRFINGPADFSADVAPTKNFDRTLADALKISAELDSLDVTITIDDDLEVELDGTNLSLVIGSEPLGHIAVVEPRHPCGVPFFHHEILYQFSKYQPLPERMVVPVCVNVRDEYGKDPDLGHCVPHAFMSSGETTSSRQRSLLTASSVLSGRALSLHIGVNEFASSYLNNTGLQPPDRLESCVRDAWAMQRFAKVLGFEALNRDDRNVIADAAATRRGLIDAFKAYGPAAGPGSFFLLTFSGHGMPRQFRGGGWCLNTRILLYDDLRQLLKTFFGQASRIMVISDCCHSGTMNESNGQMKEIPMQYAAALFSLDFASLSFDELGRSFGDVGREDGTAPTIYFAYACGEEETITDGGRVDLSPFTKCVIAHPHDPTVSQFETNVGQCCGKHSHIDRMPRDAGWESGEPFSMPAAQRPAAIKKHP